jgi:hypothetical protein
VVRPQAPGLCARCALLTSPPLLGSHERGGPGSWGAAGGATSSGTHAAIYWRRPSLAACAPALGGCSSAAPASSARQPRRASSRAHLRLVEPQVLQPLEASDLVAGEQAAGAALQPPQQPGLGLAQLPQRVHLARLHGPGQAQAPRQAGRQLGPHGRHVARLGRGGAAMARSVLVAGTCARRGGAAAP